MATMQGPAIFLAQFVGPDAPFDNLDNIARWAGDLGYRGVQIPTWESGLIDLETAAESKDYCDELKGTCAQYGIEVTELSTHLQGQLVAAHPAYDELFDGFAPESVRGNPRARQAWAVNQHFYFSMNSSLPFEIQEQKQMEIGDSSQTTKYLLTFDLSDSKELILKVGMSSVSSDAAQANMEAEVSSDNWDFDALRQKTQQKWNKALGKIEVKGGSLDDQYIIVSAREWAREEQVGEGTCV